MKKRIVAVLATCLALAACSSTQPDWVDQPSGEYPQQDYLSAVGEAETRSAADERALANLARIFEVTISDVSQDFSLARVSRDQSGSTANNVQAASRHVTSETRQVLEGAQVVKSWQSEDGRTYSLAVLEKAPAARRFRNAVRSADRQIRDRVAYAGQQAPNPVAALAALEQARTIEIRRSHLNRNLAVVSGKGIKAPHDQSSLDRLLRDALATLHFTTETNSAAIRQNLEDAISALGITLDKNAPYRVTATLDTEPVKQQQGWYWLRGSTQLSLMHQGETLAQKRWPLKVSALDPGMLEQRTRDKLDAQMTAYLYELITSAE